MLRVMRRQGEKNNPKGLQVGVMGEDGSCRVGNLTLEADDLLFNQVLVNTAEGCEALRAAPGDTVLVQRLSEEQYAVICKLV